jgi:hypothetical protein
VIVFATSGAKGGTYKRGTGWQSGSYSFLFEAPYKVAVAPQPVSQAVIYDRPVRIAIFGGSTALKPTTVVGESNMFKSYHIGSAVLGASLKKDTKATSDFVLQNNKLVLKPRPGVSLQHTTQNAQSVAQWAANVASTVSKSPLAKKDKKVAALAASTAATASKLQKMANLSFVNQQTRKKTGKSTPLSSVVGAYDFIHEIEAIGGGDPYYGLGPMPTKAPAAVAGKDYTPDPGPDSDRTFYSSFTMDKAQSFTELWAMSQLKATVDADHPYRYQTAPMPLGAVPVTGDMTTQVTLFGDFKSIYSPQGAQSLPPGFFGGRQQPGLTFGLGVPGTYSVRFDSTQSNNVVASVGGFANFLPLPLDSFYGTRKSIDFSSMSPPWQPNVAQNYPGAMCAYFEVGPLVGGKADANYGLRYDYGTDSWFWFYDKAPSWARDKADQVRLEKAQLDWHTAFAAAQANDLKKQTDASNAASDAEKQALQKKIDDLNKQLADKQSADKAAADKAAADKAAADKAAADKAAADKAAADAAQAKADAAAQEAQAQRDFELQQMQMQMQFQLAQQAQQQAIQQQQAQQAQEAQLSVQELAFAREDAARQAQLAQALIEAKAKMGGKKKKAKPAAEEEEDTDSEDSDTTDRSSDESTLESE